jgi:preprotein translocase subunit SecE
MDSLKSYLDQSVGFVKEAYTELAKVHYPTPRETMQATIVVLALTFVMALWLGLVDVGATRAVRFLIG